MRTAALALAALLVTALLIPACVTTGGSAAPDDDLLMQCRAKADTQVKARYTPRWQAAVDQCVREAQAQ